MFIKVTHKISISEESSKNRVTSNETTTNDAIFHKSNERDNIKLHVESTQHDKSIIVQHNKLEVRVWI